MALSVVKRPIGYIKSTSSIGTFTNASSVISINATDYAAISTGSIIYISNGQAMGFWYVSKSGTSGQISISEYSTATAYSFIGAGMFTFYFVVSSTGHGWNAIHLPIVYKLKSTLWPTNSVDTARTVSSFSNDNGYVKLTLSGALLSSLSELEFVKITGIGEAGVYQILTWYSTSIITINLAYYSSLSFGPATVQYYYNNYRAKVRLYAGLTSSHTFASLKPYTLVTEREIVPDSSGIITLNINEDLKGQLDLLKNDLTKGTLPNNLDAWIQFYITYAEAYDYSAGGYGLLDFVGSYTSDLASLEGYAVNASLPFKNVYSGNLSDYVYGSSSYLLKFLTPSLYPYHFNNYFDISFISRSESGLVLRKQTYLNGSLQATSDTTISGYSSGVYRKQITLTSNEDRIDLTLVQPAQTLAGITTWSNNGSGKSWGTGIPQVILTGSPLSSKILTTPFVIVPGLVYSFTITITSTVHPIISINVSTYNNSFVAVESIAAETDDFTGTYILTATKAASYIGVTASYDAGATVTITALSCTVAEATLSETKTLTVDTSCTSNYVDISWLNYLGGFDYWRFKGYADYGNDIIQAQEDTKNILPQWPQSYGEGADTIRREISRTSRPTVVLRAENLTADQVQDLGRLKLSTLVQIVNSATDRRTVIPDKSSFTHYPQANKLYTFNFTITYTDDNPVQSL